jgi:hypothetical protein
MPKFDKELQLAGYKCTMQSLLCKRMKIGLFAQDFFASFCYVLLLSQIHFRNNSLRIHNSDLHADRSYITVPISTRVMKEGTTDLDSN